VIRIGGASGFWGDSSVGAPQLVASGQIDYLVFDYLAELTMSILAAPAGKNPELGYATDFVTVAMKPCCAMWWRSAGSASSATPAASTRRPAREAHGARWLPSRAWREASPWCWATTCCR
jgi:hypothetical protein